MTQELPSAAQVEAARMAAVRRYDILDTPPDGAFDRVAAMAARLYDAPMASVTIVDEDRIWLKAREGLDDFSEAPREPGLCASVIAPGAGASYVVSDALSDPRTAKNSMVHGRAGIRFYAAAPLVTADGHRLGTVNILDVRPRRIGFEELANLRDLAAVVVDELELRLSSLTTLRVERKLREQIEHEHQQLTAIASTLQRSLLPAELPLVPGVELAGHYHPASPHEIGGDFYDVTPIGGNGGPGTSGAREWAFFLGDVSGKGASAAAMTSQARYTLRAAAGHTADPCAVLEELNAALLCREDDPRMFCTVVFGIVRPLDDGTGRVRLTLSSGGHPPPYVLRADGRVEPVPVEGMLVGAWEQTTFTATEVDLMPGDTVILYTDGLTEARTGPNELLDDMGGLEARLRALCSSGSAVDAAGVVGHLATVLAELGSGVVDDVALLGLSVPAE